MKTILSFGASSSEHSINQKLANYAATSTNEKSVNIQLSDYEMPIYSIDREKKDGIPKKALDLKLLIESSDGIVISFAEHNGMVSAAFKNVYDWVSRIDHNVWSQKPMFLLSTSPGGRGGQTVLNFVSKDFNYRGGQVVATFSLPHFYENFENGITEHAYKREFDEQLQQFTASLEPVES